MAKANTQIKLLNPKGAEFKYVGGEPTWNIQPDETNRISKLARAFNWYTYHYGKKDAKDFLVHYLETHNRPKDAKLMRGVPDAKIRITPAWLARMTLVGLELNEHEQIDLDNRIKDILSAKQEVKVEKTSDEVAEAKLTIQDHLREKISECAGELEGMFDDFIQAGAKMNADYKPIALIRGMNVSPNMIGTISDIWQLKLAEFTEVLEGEDELLVEGYGQFTKNQMKQLVKFAETVIADCGSYVSIKKTERKPRAKKAVSPEKQSRGFKHLKVFEELKLAGQPAAKLVGASEAWLYDTKKRKLYHVNADSHLGSFTVKGSAIIGFDPATTLGKTLRKPEEQLKAITTAGKPQARKIFKDIKATETKYNGRGNENLVILKAW